MTRPKRRVEAIDAFFQDAAGSKRGERDPAALDAANRVTSSGRVLGANERLGVLDALKLVTINAAALLHRDHEIGSIQVGKRADFTVVGADPLAVAAAELKDVPVLGTVLGGQPVVL